MEYALHIFEPDHLASRGPHHSRIYFGAEFCQYRIPGVETLEEVINNARSRGLAFTYVTPWVTDSYLAKLKEHFELLKGHNNVEVVFNDWGVFNLLRREYSSFSLILGRLLTKQKKDPRLIPLIERDKNVTITSEGAETRVVTNILNLPPKVVEYYESSNINTERFSGYLLKNAIHRAEVDNLLHGINIGKNAELKVSLCMPYGYITVGRICTTKMILEDDYRIQTCHDESCRGKAFSLKYEGCDFTVFLQGNAQYFFNDQLPQNIAETAVDRIVDNSLLFRL